MTPAEKLSKQKSRKPKSANPRHSKFICILSNLRHEHGLTIRDVSEATGITPASISVIEHGSDPQLTTAFKLAAFFGLPIEKTWEPIPQKKGPLAK